MSRAENFCSVFFHAIFFPGIHTHTRIRIISELIGARKQKGREKYVAAWKARNLKTEGESRWRETNERERERENDHSSASATVAVAPLSTNGHRRRRRRRCRAAAICFVDTRVILPVGSGWFALARSVRNVRTYARTLGSFALSCRHGTRESNGDKGLQQDGRATRIRGEGDTDARYGAERRAAAQCDPTRFTRARNLLKKKTV